LDIAIIIITAMIRSVHGSGATFDTFVRELTPAAPSLRFEKYVLLPVNAF
jgi:hypothetical protein